MAGTHEDEIYSVMFTSLKHPVRRKILRMLGNKSMTFMEMVEELGISSPNLTYHLESLGELVSKMENDKYKLSSFGLATISAMKGIEEVHVTDPKRRTAVFKWRAITAVLLVAVLLLSGMAVFQFTQVNGLNSNQQNLAAENQQLLSYGGGTDKVLNFLQNVTKINTKSYTMSALSNTMQWRTDFGGVAEEVMQYALANSTSNLNVDFRFRNNHFSRYQLDMIESSPIFAQLQPSDVLHNAKGTIGRYRTFSGDDYLTNMIRILDTVSTLGNTNVTQGNIKLQITVSAGTVVFSWMYTENGIDYQAKGVQMTFQNNVLTTITDGFFLFTVGSTGLAVSQEQAVSMAESYVKTLSWNIEGKSTSNFTVIDPPLSVQMVPHTRGNSVALFPYWYVEMHLDRIYAGGINEVTVGIYADTGQVADVQMLSTGTSTET